MLKLWRGYHSLDLVPELKCALAEGQLLILIPPMLRDFKFIRQLPSGKAELAGEWDSERHDALVRAGCELHGREVTYVPEVNAWPGTELDVPAHFSDGNIGDGARFGLNVGQAGTEPPILGVFTSGSVSGTPRLVLYTKTNFISSLESIRSLFDTSKIKSIFCFPQPTHTFGLILGYVHALQYGLELIVPEGKYSRHAQDMWFQKVNATTLTLGTPAHFYDLQTRVQQSEEGVQRTFGDGAQCGLGTVLGIQANRSNSVPNQVGLRPQPAQGDRVEHNFQSSYSCICGGAPVDVQLWNQMRDQLKIQYPSIGYGASEASPGITHLPPGYQPQHPGEIGWPLKNVEVRISESGLEFSGPNVCFAYLDQNNWVFPKSVVLKDHIEQVEHEGSTANGPYRDSVLVYRGRLELLMNRGGQKIALEQVEDILRNELKINSMSVPIADPRLGEELGLLIEGGRVSSHIIQTTLKRILGIEGCVYFVHTLPVTDNGKPDRKKGAEWISRIRSFQLPLSVRDLSEWIPHRPPAVWVDSVLEADFESGVCQVLVDIRGNAFDERGHLRLTSQIEWMAQSYAYVRAYQGLSGLIPSLVPPRKAFLVALKNVEFINSDLCLKDGERIRIRVKRTHELGPISLISGEVFRESDEILCKGLLKLYAE